MSNATVPTHRRSSLIHHGATLALITAIVALAACSADSPTGVADRRIIAPRPLGEHLVCVPEGGGEVSPSDTVSMPSGGTCPIGFDQTVWW